jgi:hypothetical protein
MSKIYFVRHQAAGVLTDYPFASSPTDKQLEALSRLCFQRHGATHPKGDSAYWTRVVELDVLGPNDIPEVPERDLSSVSAGGSASASEFTVSGVGTVTPKKGAE